jgi:hypothetical protein
VRAKSAFAADASFAYVVGEAGGSATLIRFGLTNTTLGGTRKEVAKLAGDKFRDVLVDENYIYVEQSREAKTTTVSRVAKTDGRVVDVKVIESRSIGDDKGRRFAIDACNFYWSDGDKIYSQPKYSLAPL